MALKVKKTKSGILIPKTTSNAHNFFANSLGKFLSMAEEDIVIEQIKLMLKERLSISGRTDLERIEYFVTYQMCNLTKEKQLSNVYMKHNITKIKSVVSAEEIELTGVMLLEFFDYINTNGAIEIQDTEQILELV